MTPLYWWRGRNNFGDALSPVIVSAVLGEEVQRATESPKLLAIGSILPFAGRGDTIWGSGAHPEYPAGSYDLNVLAVRGPITRAELLKAGCSCPELFGDPALLLPRFYEPTGRIRETVVVPHYSDDAGRLFSRQARLDCTLQALDWRVTANIICKAKLVLASALHGLVVAEAYGIPAVWVGCDEGHSKYHDYYLGTGREPPKPVTWEEALKAKPAAPLNWSKGDELVDALKGWATSR